MRPLPVVAAVALVALTPPAAASAQVPFAPRQQVEVERGGSWWTATILEAKGGTYRVHYDGHDGARDETVPASRVRAAASGRGTATNDAAPSTPTPPATSAARTAPDGTLLADRPILACPVAQPRAVNGSAPDLKLLALVFRCQWGEKPAAPRMDGAVTVDVQSMQVGRPRRMDLVLDKGNGTPGKTIVYPIRVTWTERTYYRERTIVVADKSAVLHFNVNDLGEWQYGSGTDFNMGHQTMVPRAP